MSASSFTPALFDSYSNLREFLVGKAKDELVRGQILGASKPATCLPAPFCKIYCIFAKAIGNLLYYLGLTSWGLYLYLDGEMALKNRDMHGYLTKTANLYSPDCAGIYALPRMKTEELANPRVRELVHPDRKELTFDQKNGLCRGKSLWCIRAFLKTRGLFQSHLEHMKAVGGLFSRGAPPEAALIQKLCPPKQFLGLKEISTVEVPLQRETKKILDTRAVRKIFIETVKSLPKGAYYFRVPRHGMAYFTPVKGKGYWFDPNTGLKAIENREDFRNLANKILAYHIKRLPKLRAENAEEWKSSLCKFIQLDLA